MAWRIAKSLETLRGQVNEKWPGRSKVSDGSIGNEEHSARLSDHNPNGAGVVCAIDITHDPANRLDSQLLAEALLRARDPRIKYIISNRKIASGAAGPSPWTWRPYTGSNAHNHHVHISVKADKARYDDPGTWDLGGVATPASDKPLPVIRPKLRRGDDGEAVKELQRLLGITADGDFGAATEAAVKDKQKAANIVPDGIVGPYTWEILT